MGRVGIGSHSALSFRLRMNEKQSSTLVSLSFSFVAYYCSLFGLPFFSCQRFFRCHRKRHEFEVVISVSVCDSISQKHITVRPASYIRRVAHYHIPVPPPSPPPLLSTSISTSPANAYKSHFAVGLLSRQRQIRE